MRKKCEGTGSMFRNWIPACAGMTLLLMAVTSLAQEWPTKVVVVPPPLMMKVTPAGGLTVTPA